MSEQSYTVYEPGDFKKDLLERADDIVFVKDGFSWWAALIPLLWMIYHRMWLPLAGFFVAATLVQILAYLIGVPQESVGLIFMGLSLAFGFLANDIRREMLERQNYRLAGSIAGHSQLDCERRFFDNWRPLRQSIAMENNSESETVS